MGTIYAILIVKQLFLILVYGAKMNNYSTLKISLVKSYSSIQLNY